MTRSIRALLEGLIDYAGLFPPASLAMADAASNYATYRRGPQAWMLGRFIVPVARLDEFAQAAAQHVPSGSDAIPWRLSALASGTGSADLAADLTAIDAFHQRQADAARIDALEVKLGQDADVAALAAELGGSRLTVWFEVTPDASLGARLMRIAESGHGVKLRTGGVTPDAIPSSEVVARVLLASARAGVRVKATAGLHHPIRAPHRLTYADDSPTAVMHGFVNVFVAAALARDLLLYGYPEPEAQATVVALLDETDPRAFAWEDDAVAWRRQRVPLATLTEVRDRAARSFGSCSFDEPVGDLKQLGWI